MTTKQVGRVAPDALDLAAVQADDALLDLLGSADCMPGDLDSELASRLAAWRREVHLDSDRLLVDTGTALLVMGPCQWPLRVGLAAAALPTVLFATVGLIASSAAPGDLLYPLHQLLYPGGAQ